MQMQVQKQIIRVRKIIASKFLQEIYLKLKQTPKTKALKWHIPVSYHYRITFALRLGCMALTCSLTKKPSHFWIVTRNNYYHALVQVRRTWPKKVQSFELSSVHHDLTSPSAEFSSAKYHTPAPIYVLTKRIRYAEIRIPEIDFALLIDSLNIIT